MMRFAGVSNALGSGKKPGASLSPVRNMFLAAEGTSNLAFHLRAISRDSSRC